MMDSARRYLSEGRSILPVRAGAKATRVPDWPNAVVTEADFQPGDNIAERLDAIVDVDCDTPEARLAAATLLLHTDRRHGRPRVGTTHYFFCSPESRPEVFRDTDQTVIIEIRTGNQQYTLIPPSVLPCKDDPSRTEQLVWERDGAPNVVAAEGLRESVRLVATAALLARHWPRGSRHVAARDAAGFLAARGVSPSEIETVIRCAAAAAGDDEIADRARVARDSAAQFAAGGKTTGLPKLADSMGADVAALLNKWFGGRTDSFPLTEAGDAEAFAERYADCVRFDHRRGRWLLTENGLWLPDCVERVHQLVIEAVRERRRAAADIQNRATRKAVTDWLHNGESRRRISNTLSLARSVAPLNDPGDAWDHDPWLLGVPNGVVDLRTGELRPAQPEDRITMRAAVPFDPGARRELWERTIQDIFSGNAALIDYVHRALGYSICGDMREECFFITWGIGRNGKGVMMNTIGRLLGDYADNLSFSALELHQRNGGGASPELAKLPGKRFVTASESGDVRLNEARIKALTGRDPVTARGLYQDEFTFEPVAKFWLATNKKPRVKDESEGFWSRVKLIPFTRTFAANADPTLKDRLRDESAGILAWLVRGCLAWQQRGLTVDVPADVINATNQYRHESEPLTPFYDDCCVVDEAMQVSASALWNAYGSWADGRHLKPFERFASQKAFSQEVQRRFGEPRRTKAGNAYRGIGLLDVSRELRNEEFEFRNVM